MGKKVAPLTDLEVKNGRRKGAKPTSTLFDGDGLFLLTKPSGKRHWRLKYTIKGRPRLLALGVYPDVSLAEARDTRDNNRKLIAKGIDPIEQKRQEASDAAAKDRAELEMAAVRRETRFRKIAYSWYEQKARSWSATHEEDVIRILESHLLPVLGDMPIADIRRIHVETALNPLIERDTLSQAYDARMYYRIIVRHFNQSRDEGEIPDVSAKIVLPKPPKEKGHPALPLQEVGGFLRALALSDARAITRIATKLLILTGVRTTELRGAHWSEIDRDAKLWRLPPARMKDDEPHLVPLSQQALVLLEALRQHSGRGDFLFPNERDADRIMSENAILAVIKRIGYRGRQTGHGFRSWLSTWAHEAAHKLGWTSDAIEVQLSHDPFGGSVKGSYLRTAFLPDRTRMMQAWADWLDEQERGSPIVTAPAASPTLERYEG